ncbi:16S rRNA (uracil(1498)-N(3))-methyltransferase [Pleionea sp. CnH1-48]|uniref:16S rRNA (uracil(1498)-N(3))-methyltransferase n=1 Tax=Pleionea sp. CnH1-48 TaxID=2954494 RepID=UPI0020979B57|nr:16S rRNA (uracil(1498)-N(3))-methyltransferase [Pleionea sp. CnH1-48]MCO7226207.1 16S rRNA (uracil(1498)-N(3))-methyltransferase [Pleionea sp. CnH1-48]
MRYNRVYVDEPLAVGQAIKLPPDQARHLATVLRMAVREKVVLFNGDGFEYFAVIEEIQKKSMTLAIEKSEEKNNESPLNLHLIQGISRGDKMDLTIQKAVELGVQQITPLLSERCGVKLNSERMEKKLQHWRKIITSACEQCGRNSIPVLNSPVPVLQLHEIMNIDASYLLLDPHKGQSVRSLSAQDAFSLVIGPEGGLTDLENQYIQQHGGTAIQLGPRVLRTETAGLTAISLLQGLFGDF